MLPRRIVSRGTFVSVARRKKKRITLRRLASAYHGLSFRVRLAQRFMIPRFACCSHGAAGASSCGGLLRLFDLSAKDTSHWVSGPPAAKGAEWQTVSLPAGAGLTRQSRNFPAPRRARATAHLVSRPPDVPRETSGADIKKAAACPAAYSPPCST